MPLKVIVVGSGIGGPAVAAALARQGHSVTIYERARSREEVGYAFRVTANSDRCLKYLGIDTVAGGAAQANTSRHLDQTGKVVKEIGEDKDFKRVKDGANVFASWSQLARQLTDKAKELGVSFKTGVKIVKVDTENTAIIFEDGTQAAADLIIGADGIYSTVRSAIVDAATFKPQHTLECNCFRFLVPRSAIASDDELSKLFTDQYRFISWSNDADKRIITYPVDYDSHYCVTCSHPAQLSDSAILQEDHKGTNEAATVSYDKRVALETVHKIYDDFEPRLHKLFDKADPNGFRIWRLQELNKLPQWSANRTVLIGDAAHALLPFVFSGASMAIEDSIIVAELLPADVKINDVASRLELLQQIRQPRLQKLRELSIELGKGAPGTPEIMQYIAQYDAVEVGKEALERCLKGQTQ